MKIIGSTAAFKGDLDYALGRLAAFGFSEVDLIAISSWGHVSLEALVADFETESARISGLLEKHSLRAVSVNAAFSPDLNDRADPAANAARLEQVRALARLMEQLGIGIGAQYPGYIASWKNDPAGVWADTVTSLREIQAALAGFPLTLAPEIHYETPFEHPDAARRLLREFPGLPYTYEPSHFIIRGHDIRDTADLLAAASHVHLRGCAPGRIQAPPDDSAAELQWVVESLRHRNYQGIISIEYLPGADFDTEAAIQDLHHRARSWAAPKRP